jgi:hypothetical protein
VQDRNKKSAQQAPIDAKLSIAMVSSGEAFVVVRLALTALLCLSGLGAALATPARIIILRHGEKATAYKLCDVGRERAEALTTTYLGRGAAKSLFARGEAPAAMLAITLHTLELASPSAASWGEPLTLYFVLPDKDADEDEKAELLNRRTQEAAHDVMTDPRYAGKTVVMVWEHKHIANKKLEDTFPGKAVTLRQLLKLDELHGVPEKWPSGTYDYFWIAEYGNQGSDVPTRFHMVKQEFGASYDAVPSNDWDQPNGLEPESGCDLKGAQD